MGVLHDWECDMHGVFEAETPEPKNGNRRSPRCPHGCHPEFVHMVFTKPPGMRGAITSNTDRQLRDLADAYGMTNIQNNRGGDGGSVKAAEKAVNGTPPSLWIDVPHSRPGFSSRGEKPEVYNAKSFTKSEAIPGFSPGEKSFIPPPRPAYVGKPKED